MNWCAQAKPGRSSKLKGACRVNCPFDAKRLFTNNMKVAIVFARHDVISYLQRFSDHHIGNISWFQLAFAKRLFASINRQTLEDICKTNADRAKAHFAALEDTLNG